MKNENPSKTKKALIILAILFVPGAIPALSAAAIYRNKDRIASFIKKITKKKKQD